MTNVEIDFTSPTLFGNEVAEDENEDVFNAYWVPRPEEKFLKDPYNRIAIVLAYKGEGKSGLLRAISQEIDASTSTLVIKTTGQDAAPSLSSIDSTEWGRAWKNSLLNLIASEVGAIINTAWNDDDISLVELAEKNGFRRKSLISTILDRLQFSVDGNELKKSRVSPSNTEKTLSRSLNDNTKIWLFIDDTDKNFMGTKEWTARLCGLLDALRDITKAVPQLIVRASLRPNVWAVISGSYESLSHVRQYLVTLPWTETDARNMISRRIEGYLARTGQIDDFNQSCPAKASSNAWKEELLKLVFESPTTWANKTKSIYQPIFTLAKHRPRWMVELMKLAAMNAKRSGAKNIRLDHLVSVMAEFGQSRKTDTIAEFGAQCSDINELIDAFHQQKEEFTTDELLALIDNRILTHLKPIIPGVIGTARNRDIASVLFEIGFIYGRKDNPDGSYEHISYAANPALFRSRTNMDAGLRWEIHPIFRQSLDIRDSSGKVTKQQKAKRTSRKRK